MAHFEDLSRYVYLSRIAPQSTKNVGWLERGHHFDEMVAAKEILDALWNHCTISVVQTRGIHLCNLCMPGKKVVAERNGRRVLLGTSEIRVFAASGEIYAAPTLIFHYVRTHRYKPPAEFLSALTSGPRPPAQEYFERLRSIGLDYSVTSPQSGGQAFKFEEIDRELRRVEVTIPTYLDES